MLYDSKTIKYIQECFESGTNELRVYATEMLDLTVSSEIKEIFVPLLEDLAVEDSLRLFKDKYPQQKMDVVERLRDIINKDYLKINRWTKACALVYLKNFPGNENIFLSNLLNPDPFIMQNSMKVLKQQDSERFKVVYSKLNKDRLSFIEKYPIENSQEILGLSLSEKVNRVKNNLLFTAFSNPELSRVIENSLDISLKAGEEFNPRERTPEAILIVLSGKLAEYSDSQRKRDLIQNEFYWGIVTDDYVNITLKAEIDCRILVLSPEMIFNAMAENSDYTLEVIRILNKTA
jgi:hypothetical protein